MSSNLYWEPTARKKSPLANELKLVLRKMYGDLQGAELGEGDLPQIRALEAAGVSGSTELIAAIEKHGSVTLREVY